MAEKDIHTHERGHTVMVSRVLDAHLHATHGPTRTTITCQWPQRPHNSAAHTGTLTMVAGTQ